MNSSLSKVEDGGDSEVLVVEAAGSEDGSSLGGFVLNCSDTVSFRASSNRSTKLSLSKQSVNITFKEVNSFLISLILIVEGSATATASAVTAAAVVVDSCASVVEKRVDDEEECSGGICLMILEVVAKAAVRLNSTPPPLIVVSCCCCSGCKMGLVVRKQDVLLILRVPKA